AHSRTPALPPTAGTGTGTTGSRLRRDAKTCVRTSALPHFRTVVSAPSRPPALPASFTPDGAGFRLPAAAPRQDWRRRGRRGIMRASIAWISGGYAGE